MTVTSKKNFSNKVITFLLVLLLAGFGVGLLLRNLHAQSLVVENATLLPKPQLLPEFQLTGINNEAFTNRNLEGHWSMLFFGFTNCPSICPTTMTELKKAFAQLAKDKISPPQVVFISVDPDRDSLVRIKQYVTNFNPDFFGARGSKEQLNDITRPLDVLYMKVANPKNEKANNYVVDHTGNILLIDPKGEFYAVFSMPHDGLKIAHDFAAIQRNAKFS